MNVLIPLSSSDIDLKKIISSNDTYVQTMWTGEVFVNKYKSYSVIWQILFYFLFYVLYLSHFFNFFLI
jgi:hypothetical protein